VALACKNSGGGHYEHRSPIGKPAVVSLNLNSGQIEDALAQNVLRPEELPQKTRMNSDKDGGTEEFKQG
jgi:hypothetical protein